MPEESSRLRNISVDLKSFFASVECVKRGLDPLKARLVVADADRTNKTICLAVSPALRSLGLPGRPRLFEVERVMQDYPHLDFVVAKPHMSSYLDYSRRVREVYLKYVCPGDVFFYSIDEAFLDTSRYKMPALEMARRILRDILLTTGLTATAGVGSNLYLAKIAMDIIAKHKKEDRVATLNEESFRSILWKHEPLRDFWNIGSSTEVQLHQMGIRTMEALAYVPIQNLRKRFGVRAEGMLNHAWGRDNKTVSQMIAYQPKNNSLSAGQVLPRPYTADEARIIISEMADHLSYRLVKKDVVTDQLVINIGYEPTKIKGASKGNAFNPDSSKTEISGSINLGRYTSASSLFIAQALTQFDQMVTPRLLIRKIAITASHILPDKDRQLDLFGDIARDQKELRLQQTVLSLKAKFGNNSILKGMSLLEGATMKDRNNKIGGHNA